MTLAKTAAEVVIARARQSPRIIDRHKPGRSAFSVPKAYVTHAPKDGNPSIVKPVLKKFSPCGCAAVSECSA